jgi:hypothetical protein
MSHEIYGSRYLTTHQSLCAIEMKSVICIRNDDAAMRPLYCHLAGLPNPSGKRYRARIVAMLLELGASLLFAPRDAASEAFVLAARSMVASASADVDRDGGPIRVELELPNTLVMQPLLQRLDALPGGKGTQARSRLVLQALQAGVNAAYLDLPAAVAAPSNLPGRVAVAEQAPQPTIPDHMEGYLDNLSFEGLVC